ncbi:MAG: protein kinase [Candidatus Omnitrophota bacterium]|nr:MAG: protein kinase [Candidatus Omnitrophota bacterium]
MEYSNRWRIIEHKGEGGQGKVYRVIDNDKFNITKIRTNIEKAVKYMGPVVAIEDIKKNQFELFKDAIVHLVKMEDPSNHGALKVLHSPQDARNAGLAEKRIEREIKAMSNISHPNLLKIIDADPDSKWFVSQFYPKETMAKHLNKFTGDFAKALRAFRPLVEGIAKLHEKNNVHRDIKPQNIFLDSSDNLILGDFGLIFFTDQRHTRISGTWENVGSRDWMPGWAIGMRIEDVKPSFDVFCLGKVLWAMVSDTPILPLWYFDRPDFNLEKKFPSSRLMRLANSLLKKCIVEDEKNCLRDASELLAEVDNTLSIIDEGADRLDPDIERLCRVCGIGKYKLIADRDPNDMMQFGFKYVGTHSMKIFTCGYCGHVQLFSFHGNQKLSAWPE